MMDRPLDEFGEIIEALSSLMVCISMEAIATVVVEHGIPWQESYRLIAQSIGKTANELAQTGVHPAEMKDRLVSGGNASAAALRLFEQVTLRAKVIDACQGIFELIDKEEERP